jgi:cell shape-determining protein MreC
MKRLFFTYRRLRVALVLLLLITSLLPNDLARSVSVGPRTMVQGALASLAYPLTIMSNRLRPGRDSGLDLGTASQAEERVKFLTGENLRLRQEVEDLRQRLKMSAQLMEGMTLVPAEVAYGSGDPLNPALTLRLPRHSGVAADMVVVDAGNDLVGRVTAVNGLTATVRLVTGLDPEVFVAPAGTTDPAEGCVVRLHPRRDGVSLLAQQEDRAGSERRVLAVKTGDVVSLYDRAWPAEARGYVVGKVVKVAPWPDNPLLYRQIVVQPLVALAQLRRVSVIVPVAAGDAK